MTLGFDFYNTFPIMSANVVGKASSVPFLRNTTSDVSKRVGVFAAQLLPIGTKSKTADIKEFVAESRKTAAGKIFVGINGKGYLHILDNDPMNKSWKSKIGLSPDIHSCNLNLEIDPLQANAGKWCLRVIKNVNPGNELLLWFSEEILALIDMPFLTPKNISGHKRYHCHNCEKTFEYPNPLKIHLLLSCGKYSLNHLWNKLELCTRKRQLDAMDTSEMSTIGLMHQRCISEPPRSAFSPYKKSLSMTNSPESNEPLNLTMSPCASDCPSTPHSGIEMRLSHSLEELSGNYAADVELFASNWGKTKQGHLCVYCGKVYSRKYGLKIHIRTHTGYKPLKCKYCLRPFGDPSNLNKHVRLHASGLTPYICNLCGKIMVRRRDLDRHIKSYHSRSQSPDTREEL